MYRLGIYIYTHEKTYTFLNFIIEKMIFAKYIKIHAYIICIMIRRGNNINIRCRRQKKYMISRKTITFRSGLKHFYFVFFLNFVV